MSITNRLSAFLLITAGLVVLGFSISLYSLANWHLEAQARHHMQIGMDALTAAIEVHPADVEWEPLERKLPIGLNPELSTVRWTLHDEFGKLVDCSENLTAGDLSSLHAGDPSWRVLTRRLRAGVFEPEVITPKDVDVEMTSLCDLPTDRTAIRKSFLLTVGLSKRPMAAALNNLALAMGVISLTIWCIVGVSGHWICRRALHPIIHMAEEARSLRNSPECDSLLYTHATHDEVADLGNAYNELLASLRLSLAQQRRFAGDASHQLRTPLAAIITAVEVTLRQERESAEYKQALSVVLRRSRELQSIVEALLLLTRLNSSMSPIVKESVELYDWCKSRLESWRSHPRFADIHMSESRKETWALAQPILLAQLFDNLLDNALKYSEPGTPVHIEVDANRDSVTLTVRDRGKGVAASELTQIFEPFFRSQEVKWLGIPGTGLGLTIAKRLADAMNGELTMRGEQGIGSQLCLRLRPSDPAAVDRQVPYSTNQPVQV